MVTNLVGNNLCYQDAFGGAQSHDLTGVAIADKASDPLYTGNVTNIGAQTFLVNTEILVEWAKGSGKDSAPSMFKH
jgi:hypothetical protein